MQRRMKAENGMNTSTVTVIDFAGHDLARPECVLATASGRLYTSDRRGGVQVIEPDGSQRLIGASPALLPNGIALLRDGSFLIAVSGLSTPPLAMTTRM